jgi:outer membrane receptor protein involved in Fe transport
VQSAGFHAVLGGACALLLAGSAFCQTGSAAAGDQSGSQEALAEVVVTAEKRDSTIQKTPISMTAFSGEALQAQGVTSMLEVAQETPGVSFRTSGPGQTEFEVRGLGSSGGATATVGFYLDEMPLSAPAIGDIGKVVIDPDLYDLNRVEVLRGPQGTLYGSGSMGGTIKMITNSAKLDTYEVAADADASSTDGGGFNRSGDALLNIPLVSGTAALRVVVTSKFTDGWLDRIVVNPFPFPSNDGCAPTAFAGCARGNLLASPATQIIPRVNSSHLNSIRLNLLVQPNDRLKITTAAMYQGLFAAGYSNFDSPPGTDGTLGHYQPYNYAEPSNDTFRFASVVVAYDFDAAQLTSASSFWNRTLTQLQDQSESYQAVYDLPFFPNMPGLREVDAINQFSEELRVSSTGTGPFDWLGGAFFSNMKSRWEQSISDTQVTDYVYGEGFLAPITAADNPGGSIYNAAIPYNLKQYALFGEGSYKILPDLKLTVGARYYKYDTSVVATQAGIFTQSADAAPTTVSNQQNANGFNPKVNLSYTPTDDLTTYVTAAKGFRPGGVNLPLPLAGPNSCVPALTSLHLSEATLTYTPDSVWSYELGEKAKLRDGTVTVNSDVYYIKWNQIQQTLPLPCGYFITVNAGEARSYGGELEVNANLSPQWTVSASGGYTNAVINNPEPNLPIAPGTPVLNVPKYTGSAALIYNRPVTSELNFTGRLSATYYGSSTDEAFTYVTLPGYTLAAARLGLLADHWAVHLYCNNLTNKLALLTANNTSFSFNIPDLTRFTANQPRTIGLNASTKF